MEDIPLELTYTWREARTRGVTRRQIQQDGLPVAHGLFISRAIPATLEARCHAWAKLLPADAAFGLETAGTLLSAPLEAPSAVQAVLGPRRVLPQRAGLAVHVRQLGTDDVISHRGLRLTSPAQVFLDLAARHPEAELVAIGDALMRAGHLLPADLEERLLRAAGIRGVARARACAGLLDPRAASRPESLLRYWLIADGLPAPEVQIPIFDRWGRKVAHADLGYSEWKIALEYEGRQHAERVQFGRDVDRHSLMAADGWLVLRFAGRHLSGPTAVVHRTRRALMSRGWSG
jgi:hypothetical protein